MANLGIDDPHNSQINPKKYDGNLETKSMPVTLKVTLVGYLILALIFFSPQ